MVSPTNSDPYVALGSSFFANSDTDSDQYASNITKLPGNRFLITWTTNDASQDGNGSAIKGQIFNADGTIWMDEFLVNSTGASGTGNQLFSSSAAFGDGGYVVAWHSEVTGKDSTTQAQIFFPTGPKAGPEILLSLNHSMSSGTPMTGSTLSETPGIVSLANDRFLVTWSAKDSFGDSSGSGIRAAIYDKFGSPVVSDFLVNTSTYGSQNSPAAAVLSTGDVVLGWVGVAGSTTDNDFSGTSIRAQILDSSGKKLGVEFEVNSKTQGDQNQPTITALAEGKFLVAWRTTDTAQDGSGTAIKAQIFEEKKSLKYDLSTGAMTSVISAQKVGAEFLINTDSTHNSQELPQITALANGDFVAVWNAPTDWQYYNQVVAQVFDSSGTPKGSKIYLEDDGYAVGDASVAALDNGGFVISWNSNDIGFSRGIKTQIFAPVPENHAPVAQDDTFRVDVGGMVSGNVLANDTDEDGDGLFIPDAHPTITDHGSLFDIMPDGNFIWSADPGYHGYDSFEYTVSDGHGGEATATVTLVVNTLPEINAADSAAISENASDIMSLGAVDEDGDTLSYSLSGADAALFQVGSNGRLSFIKAANYEAPQDAGHDNVYNVTVTASDAYGGTATKDIEVKVNNVTGLFQTNARTFNGTAEEDIITGGDGKNALNGLLGNDTIRGGGADDTLNGGAGHDSLDGGDGNDLLLGGTGNDRILGGAGNDRIEGGIGIDHLTGGAGEDVFVFTPNFGKDRVLDFDANPAGGQDRLDISALGITAENFADFVTITHTGSNVLITFEGHPTSSILLNHIPDVSAITQDDFILGTSQSV